MQSEQHLKNLSDMQTEYYLKNMESLPEFIN